MQSSPDFGEFPLSEGADFHLFLSFLANPQILRQKQRQKQLAFNMNEQMNENEKFSNTVSNLPPEIYYLSTEMYNISQPGTAFFPVFFHETDIV